MSDAKRRPIIDADSCRATFAMTLVEGTWALQEVAKADDGVRVSLVGKGDTPRGAVEDFTHRLAAGHVSLMVGDLDD